MTKRLIGIIIGVFFLSVLIRIPNLLHPLAKHHEYLPAVVLLNAVSWQQGGGGNNFKYTPIMNYQNEGDKLVGNKDVLEKDGNIIYLSIGPGWYIIPYSLFEFFNLPVSVGGLRLLNLAFGCISLLMVVFLFNSIVGQEFQNRNVFIIAASVGWGFSPGMLWYFGNGYTHSAIMLPFVIGLAILLLPMLEAPDKITAGRLLAVFGLLLSSIYMDWFALIMAVVVSVICLFNIKRNFKYIWLFGVLMVSSISAILLIFGQFAAYAGSEAVKQYWADRFSTNTGIISASNLGLILGHYVTAYLPLLMGSLCCFLLLSKRLNPKLFSQKEYLFLSIWGVSLVLYHLIFLRWSTNHEFSAVPAIVFIAFVFGRFFAVGYAVLKRRYWWMLLGGVVMFSIAQYFYINPPGKKSWAGMPYDTYELLGKHLSAVDGEYRIFMQLSEANPMIEYYARRNITNMPNVTEARVFMKKWNISKAVWVQQTNFIFEQIVYLDAEQ